MGGQMATFWNSKWAWGSISDQRVRKKRLPKLSFINRNQVLIWVSVPTSTSRIRGILVMMNSYIDDIRTEPRLSISERGEVELGGGSTFKTKEDGQGTLSVSIAQVQKQVPSGPNRLRAALPAVITKHIRRSPVSGLAEIPAHEYLARGWDANENKWRGVLWPKLDKDCMSAESEKTSPVWEIQCPWGKDQNDQLEPEVLKS
ncbi:hypothetical protein B0H14DRAFT_866235 [Mycena olivaceomarginata]|nr:hypothetical protein B0H14DRAFT_866235 [Mycena olivaceomarginata]